MHAPRLPTRILSLKLEMAHLNNIPSPARAPTWLSPWMPCYGAFSGPLNVRAPWGECEFKTRDRCDACARPVCAVHARKYWPHRELPPGHMAVAHRCIVGYNDPAGHPYSFAMLCYDCQAVNLDWEYPMPLMLHPGNVGRAPLPLAARPNRYLFIQID